MKNQKEKPVAEVIGQNGNVFNLIAICSRALKRAGQLDEAKRMQQECFAAESYDQALQIMSNYCELE